MFREFGPSVSARTMPDKILASGCPDGLLKLTVVPSARLTCVLAEIFTKAVPPLAVLRVSPARTVPGPGTGTPPTDAPDDEIICPMACWPPVAGRVLKVSPRTKLRQMTFLRKRIPIQCPYRSLP